MSRVTVSTPDGHVIGAAFQQWHPFRRKYDVAADGAQFGVVDAPFMSWTFDIADSSGAAVAQINKDFTGFAMEVGGLFLSFFS